MGETISALRKNTGMTQKELADYMQVTDKAVSKWERNLSCPDINSVPRLAEVLGVSVEELLDCAAQKPQGDSQREKVMDLILTAVPLAMGIAVVVASIMKTIDMYSGLTMLGLGMACMAISELKKRKE